MNKYPLPNPQTRRLGVIFFLIVAVIISVAFATARRAHGQGGGQVAIVSAASFAAPLAPNAIAAAFGQQLATQLVVATTLPLPTTLAGTTVRVNGQAAPLFFVSPGQINFLIPPGTPAGAANISVTAGNGVTSSGTVQLAAVAPAIFTANANGQGVPAAVLLRVAASGAQTTEPVFATAANRFVPKPISLCAAGEKVFLILFLSGSQRATAANVRVLLGGQALTPAYAGAQGGFAGLDQINVEIPPSLAGSGLLKVSVTAQGAPPSNEVEIEIAPACGARPPSITSLSTTTLLAGQELLINGADFSAVAAENFVRFSGAETQPQAQIIEASPTRLRVLAPFGASSGKISVRTPLGESETPAPVALRTSISGFIQDNKRQALRGVTLRAGGLTATTNAEGAFVLPDAPVSDSLIVEVDGTTVTGGNYVKELLKLPVRAARDNQFPGYIELKQAIGPSVIIGAGSLQNASLSALAEWRAPDRQIQNGQVILDIPDNAVVRFPNGATSGALTLSVLDSGRTPGTLPVGQFSPVIAQITPFGATITPGAKLTFPNPDGYAANSRVKLFRFDQRQTVNGQPNPTLGTFIETGDATVSADGLRVESAANAVTETSYYFASGARPTVTLIGRVVENNLNRTPVRRSLVNARGQGIFTDGNGGFVIRNVPVNASSALAARLSGEVMIEAGIGEVVIADDRIGVEADFMRPSTRVDRSQQENVPPVGSGPTISPDLILSPVSANRAPTVFAPANLTMNAGTTRETIIFASDPDIGQTVQVAVAGASFASVIKGAADNFTLRLTPGANDGGNYTLTLTASDGEGGRASQELALRVNGVGLTADDKVVVVNRNTPTAITLTGSDPANRPLTFIVTSQPSRGALSGSEPNVTYTPQTNYVGTDSFTFKVRAGQVESNEATVTIRVQGANMAPVLIVPGKQSVNGGETLRFTVTASDPDAGQTVTLSRPTLPPGADVAPTGPASLQFSWTPTITQAGSYTIAFTVTDNGSPALSDAKTVTITVEAKWAKTSGPKHDDVQALLFNGQSLFAGVSSGGVYVSTDQGQFWMQVNNGLPLNAEVSHLTASGANLFAATREISANGVSNYNVYRSSNQGQNWTVASNGLPRDSRGKLLEVTGLFTNGTNLYADTSGGLFSSNNQGESWTLSNTGLLDPANHPIAIISMLASGINLFAGTAGYGVYRSTNQGQSWAQVSTGLPGNTQAGSLAMSGTSLLVSTGSGIYRSTNQGGTWTLVNTGLPPDTGLYDLATSGARLYLMTSRGVAVSLDQGQSWTLADNAGLSGLASASLNYRFVASETTLVTGSQRGIYRSTNQGQNWVRANAGIADSTVLALEVKEQILFAGAERGVFRSVDQGQSWVVSGLTNKRVSDLLASGANLYAATNDGVYLSADNGQNWILRSTGISNSLVGRFPVNNLAGNGAALFATTYTEQPGSGSVYRSLNQGETWERVLSARNEDYWIFSLLANSGNIFVGLWHPRSGGGLWRSTDNGNTWQQSVTGLGGQPAGTANVESLATIGNNLFAGTDRGVFISTNQGANWTPVNNGLPLNPFLPPSFVSELGVFGVTLFAQTIAGTYVSTSLGQSWTKADLGITNARLRSFTLMGATLFTGTVGSGVSLLRNQSQSWSEFNNGLGLTNKFVNAIVSSGNSYFAGTRGGGVFRSTDQGQSWTSASAGLPQGVNIQSLVTNGVTLWAATFGDGVYRSTDQGANWTAVNTGLGNSFVNRLFLSGTALYAGTEGGVYRSLDSGESWLLLNTGMGNLSVSSFAAFGGTIYAGTEGSGTFRLNSDGVSWTPKNNGLTSRQVRSLVVNRNVLYAGTLNGGICLSRDSGETWTAVNNQLPDTLDVYTFAVSGEKVYAGSIYGVFVTEDEGQNWKQINAGLLNTSVTGLATNGAQLLASTSGGGMFASRIPEDSNCTYSITPTSQSFPAGGGTGSVNIAAQPGCDWAAASNVSWITISGASGSGDGAVSYAVGVNTGSSRSGALTIADRTFVVTQVGATTNPAPTLTSLGPDSTIAGSSSFTSLLVNGANFINESVVRWNGSSRPTTFVSSTQLRAAISAGDIANPGAASVTVFTPAPGGGMSNALTFFICSYAIAPTAQSFGASGGAGSVNVTTASGCAWTASSNASWLTITSGSSGSSNGTVNYSVAANTGTSSRTGMMFIAGQTFTVTQAGASCSYALAPTSQAFGASGGGGNVNVTAASGCAWTATSNDSWVAITSGASGNGNGMVNYSVAANAGGSRSGTLTIVGQTFTVTQSGANTNPTPTLTSLNPSSIAAGGSVFTLTVNGANFSNDSIVRWNGGNRPTTFVSSTQLRAQIAAADIASAGTTNVTVFNPAPGGGVSNAIAFLIGAAGGTVRGTVFNAATGLPLAGATVAITNSGLATTSASNGSYTLNNAPPGAQTLNVAASGLIATQYQITVAAGQTTTQNISLSPVLAAGQIRITLTWNKEVNGAPDDLDAHLYGPAGGSQCFHVYWENKGSLTTSPFALLEVDNTELSGHPPAEAVRIAQTSPGLYRFFIHDFEGELPDGLARSRATVQIFNSTGLLRSYTVPSGAGRYWHVFELNGQTGALTEVNQLVAAPPAFVCNNAGVAVVDHKTTGGPISDNCVPPAAKAVFAPSEARVYQWTRIANARIGDVVRWDFIQPSGAVYFTFSLPLEFAGDSCFWSFINLAGSPAAALPGSWQVRVFYHGTQILTENFTISAAGITGSIRGQPQALQRMLGGSGQGKRAMP